jgi:putative heme-binding domain-containing protein
MIRFAAAALTVLFAAAVVRAQEPLPKVPDGFKIELVLQAPDIEAPTALAVAPNGDVYFAEDPMDMRGPSNKNIDKIYMLKNGDPKKRILIAEQMWAVMGMEVVGNKLYVVHYPFISVFTLDADGRATKREDLFTDVGPKSAPPGGFNDHVPSGVRMGMDGFLYVSIGDKGIPKMTRHPNDKNPDGVEVAEGRTRITKNGRFISLEGGGVIRFRPDGSRLEVFASGTRNHLDVPMDEHDRIFVRDNTDDGDGWNTRFMYIVKDGFYGYPWAFTRHPKEVLPMIHDFGGGSPCQGWVYCDDGLPEKYRGRIFHCEWGQGKIWAVKVQPEGAGFKYVDQIAFVDPTKTGVKDFRPYSMRPMADGRGFYITDWGFSGWSQKKVAGRIYKVTYGKDDVKPAPRGQDDDNPVLPVKALNHPAHSERLRAQRDLIGLGVRGAIAVRNALGQKVLNAAGKRHAVWILGEVGDEGWMNLPLELTRDADAGVRAQACRVLGTCPWQSVRKPGDGDAQVLADFAQITGRLLELLKSDPNAQVRMHAVHALQTANGRAPLLCMAEEKDVWVRFSVARLLQHRCDWKDLREQLTKEDLLSGKPAAVDVLLHALADQYDTRALELLQWLCQRPDEAIRAGALTVLTRQHQDRKSYPGTWWGTRPEQQKPPARSIAWEGTPLVRDALLKALADKDDAVRKAAVAGILAMNDPKTLDPLMGRFAKESSAAAREQIVTAVAGLKRAEALEFLGKISANAKEEKAVRVAAVGGLEKLATPAAADRLVDVYGKDDADWLKAAVVDALAGSKGAKVRGVFEESLKHPSKSVRLSGVKALGKTADPDVGPLLAPLVDDKDAEIRTAAVVALGDARATSAIPALVKATANADLQFDAIAALAKMPDVRAITAYLTGLQSKNADLRKQCKQALTAIREQAAPILDELAKRNELPPAALTELRTVYTAYAPVLSWKLIGPFPNDDKSYPPEKEQKFDAVYKGAAKDVKWSDRQGNPKQFGKVDLQKTYSPNTDVVAYGYAEIQSDADRDAVLDVGSDDSIVIWLNGKKVHEFLGDRGWKHDADHVKVQLVAGKNTLLIKCGNHAGPWEFSVAVSGSAEKYAFLKAVPKKLDLDAFREFARKNPGDAVRGEKLFTDLKGLACAKCHAVAGQGGKVGPDLAGIALRYKREDLMTSVLEPSKQIANGYETHVITTTKGNVITGVFKGDDGDTVTLMDADGKEHRIAKKDIDQRRISPISTMPNGLSDGMTLQDFADLIAFLEARKEELKAPR